MTRYSRDELAQMREMLRDSQRLVSRKINRMAKGNFGVDITGTEHDPRVSDDRIGRMSGVQIKKKLDEQKRFRKPSVGWYRGADGTLVSRQAYKNYVTRIKNYNRRVGKEVHKYDDIFIAPMGMTAKERRATMASNHPEMAGEAYEGFKKMQIVKPTQLVGTRGAVMMNEKLSSMDSKYKNGTLVKDARGYFDQMMEVVNDDYVRNHVAGLSDEQFWFLWAHTDFPHYLSIKYEAMMMARMKEPPKMLHAIMEAGDNSLSRAMDYVKFGKTLFT